MRLIIGLGNSGEKYTNNRHNVGFIVLDKLAQELGCKNYELSKKYQSLLAFYSHLTSHNSQLILAKPQTFMNDSGDAVKKLADYYKIPTENMHVVHDDLDLKLGEYKIQKGVGPKVHYGVNSINQALGTRDYWRVRIGIENRHSEAADGTSRGPVRYDDGHYLTGKDYVLQNFTEEEKEVLNDVVEKAVKELISSLQFPISN